MRRLLDGQLPRGAPSQHGQAGEAFRSPADSALPRRGELKPTCIFTDLNARRAMAPGLRATLSASEAQGGFMPHLTENRAACSSMPSSMPAATPREVRDAIVCSHSFPMLSSLPKMRSAAASVSL